MRISPDSNRELLQSGFSFLLPFDAKGIHNCIAFGCEFMGEDCHIHDANEFVRIDCLLQQAEIYVHALMKLLEA